MKNIIIAILVASLFALSSGKIKANNFENMPKCETTADCEPYRGLTTECFKGRCFPSPDYWGMDNKKGKRNKGMKKEEDA